MAGVSIPLFVATMGAISEHFKAEGLSDVVHAEDLEALRAALGRIEERARQRKAGAPPAKD